MKKKVFHGLYDICLSLSNHFNNKLLTRCKIFIGISLLVLMGSCSGDPEEEVVTCYLTVGPDEEEIIEPTCYLSIPCEDTKSIELPQPSSTDMTQDKIYEKTDDA